MSEHLDPAHALLLVAMSEREPELVAARAHAATCEACRALLAESTMLLSLLDRSDTPVAIEPALKRRIETRLYGRRWGGSHLMVLALALLSFVLAWQNGTSESALMPALGMHCAGFESAFALIPLVVGGALTRAGRVQLSPARFASYTMAFAVMGQLLLRTRCEAHDLSLHLFVFHFLVVLVAGFAGAGAARLLATRA